MIINMITQLYFEYILIILQNEIKRKFIKTENNKLPRALVFATINLCKFKFYETISSITIRENKFGIFIR